MSLSDITTEDLSTSTEVDGSHIRSHIIGRAETASRPNLDGYIKSLHALATASKMALVTVDLRKLDFMNSSCFKTFVVWLGGLAEARPEDQYRVRFLSDETKHWQSRSLGALTCFAMDLIEVQTQ